MSVQNTLISRLSSAEKSDHFSFMSANLRKCFYFLRTYVNIIKVITMGYAQFFVLITDFHMPFQNTLISRRYFRREHAIIFLLCQQPLQNLPIFLEHMSILSRFYQCAKHSFCYDNRLSDAL